MIVTVDLNSDFFHFNDNFHLSKINVDLGSDATLSETNNVVFCYTGSLFDVDTLDILLDESIIESAYGLFTYFYIKKRSREFIIGTDQLGFSPLYYTQKGNLFYFSNSLVCLKNKIGGTPNYEAWDELLNLGNLLGSKTPILGIERLTAGTKIIIKNGKVCFETFWVPEIPAFTDSMTYVEKNNELLFNSIKLTENFPGSKTVLLSGGHDSRRIAVAADFLNLPFSFATQEAIHTGDIDDDVLIAKEIAGKMSRDLFMGKLPTAKEFYCDSQSRDYWLCYESNLHEWILPLVRQLPAKTLVYDGIVGDCTVNGHYFRKHKNIIDDYGNTDKMAKDICGETSAYSFDPKMLNSALFERVRMELEKIPESPHRLTFFYLLNHTRRNIGLQAQLCRLAGHQVCFPFLYYPHFLQSLSLEPKDLIKHFYQQQCTKRINEQIAKISSTRTCVDSRFVKDYAREKKSRDLYAYMKDIPVAGEVKRLFPKLGKKCWVDNCFALTGLDKKLGRIPWYRHDLSRLSAFKQFLADDSFVCERIKP